MASLLSLSNFRYIQVETAFFWRWWNEQDQQMKDLVHELVNAGQLASLPISANYVDLFLPKYPHAIQ